MVNPIDYSGAFAKETPQQSFAQGFQIGNTMEQMNLARQQKQIAMDQQQAMQRDMANLSRNPTSEGILQATLKYPSMSEHFKRATEMLSEGEKESAIKDSQEAYSAINAGRTDIAIDMLKEKAEAYANSGNPKRAKAVSDMVKIVELNPDVAKMSIGLYMASADPKNFTDNFVKMQGEQRAQDKAPAELSEAKSKAEKAAVDAKFAESEAVLDLQKKGWDITKIQEDIKIAKENSRIAAMNAQMARETNALKRDELQLKRDEAIEKRDGKIREKVAEVETANMNIDNMLSTADKILNTPIGVIKAATGPLDTRLPTFQRDVADLEAQFENLDAQAFLSQIPNLKGMGALSDAEGKKVAAALQNFNLKQSPERLLESVTEAQRLLLKARKNIAERNGVAQSVPDRPSANVANMPAGFKILGKE